MDIMVGMDITICHQRINMPDMDHHTMMTGDMAVNMRGTNGVEAPEDGIGELKTVTNITTKDEGDGIIVGHYLLIGEAEVMTEVVDTRGGVIHDRPAVIVAVAQDGITVDAAVVRPGVDGHVHEVVRGEGERAITRMAEIENEAALLDRDRGIEARFLRTDVIHMAITIIVINQLMRLPKMVRNKQIQLRMIRIRHRPTHPGKGVGSQTGTSHRETNEEGPVAEAVVASVDRNTNDEMMRVMTKVIVEVDLEGMEVRMKEGIVVKVADIIVHEGAIKSVAMILLPALARITTLIHETRGRKVLASRRENGSAVVPNTMIHVVRTTNKPVKMEPKLTILNERRQKEPLREDIQSNHEL